MNDMRTEVEGVFSCYVKALSLDTRIDFKEDGSKRVVSMGKKISEREFK
jgi:hypothetical protein